MDYLKKFNGFSLLSIFFLGKIISIFKLSSKKLQVTALKPNQGIEDFHGLVKEKKINWLIDAAHPFSEIPKLVEYFGRGEHKGKIVVKV